MTLVDFENAPSFAKVQKYAPSVETRPSRNGYVVRVSDAANGMWARTFKRVVCYLMGVMGALLMVSAPLLVAQDSFGLWLLPAIGAYAIVASCVSLCRISRLQTELYVDQAKRTLSLVKRGIAGRQARNQTIRFEEISKLELIDGLASSDMLAAKMNWTVARLQVVWQNRKVTPIIMGDADELEVLMTRLRKDVGIA